MAESGKVVMLGAFSLNPKVPQLSFERFRRNKDGRLFFVAVQLTPRCSQFVENVFPRWKLWYPTQLHLWVKLGAVDVGLSHFLHFLHLHTFNGSPKKVRAFGSGKVGAQHMFPGTRATKCSSL